MACLIINFVSRCYFMILLGVLVTTRCNDNYVGYDVTLFCFGCSRYPWSDFGVHCVDLQYFKYSVDKDYNVVCCSPLLLSKACS